MRKAEPRAGQRHSQPTASCAISMMTVTLEQFHKPSDEANGNTFDLEGRQISARRGPGDPHRTRGAITMLAEQGQRQEAERAERHGRSPQRKSIWFTDPVTARSASMRGTRQYRAPSSPTRKRRCTGSILNRQLSKVVDETVQAQRHRLPPRLEEGLCHATPAPRMSHNAKNIRLAVRPGRGGKVSNRARLMRHDARRQVGFSRRPAGRYRRQHLGGRGLGRRRIGRRADLCAGRRPHRPDPPARDLRQSLLRRPEAKPPVHDGEPVAICRLCRGAGRA